MGERGADYLFVRRPVMAMVLSIVVVIVGVVAMVGLPVARFPEIVPPEVQIDATYTGADAVAIEQAVASPLEQQINGVDAMLYMRSTNANDGTYRLRVTFEVGTDVDVDNMLVQNRVAQADAALPAEVRATGVNVRKSMVSPTLLVSLYSPDESYDATFMSNYATINLRDALLRVPGVGQVNIFGSAEYAMRVWLDPDRLTAYGLTFEEVRAAVASQNAINPAGQVGGEPAPPGQELTYTVRAQGRLEQPEQFGAIVLRQTSAGETVRLRDVARIELGAQTYKQRARNNGQPSATMAVYQAPGSNALEVREGVIAAMAAQKVRFPPGLDYRVSLDTTAAVRASIVEIVETLAIAVVLVVLVVYVFLQSWRATLIPMLTVPVALVGTFAVFPWLGFSINTLSLFGLVLAIGLVVDDAIVVVEAVERHIHEGRSPRDATNQAMREVGSPVIAIALILASVFIPVAFVGGVTGRLYQQFALTIAISVLLSAVNALTLSPALCSLILRPQEDARGRGMLRRAFAGFDRGFERTTSGFVSAARGLARKGIVSLMLLAGMAAITAWLGRTLPTGFVPEEDQGYFYVNVQLPEAASLERTDAFCRQVEAVLEDTPGVAAYNTIVGFSLLTGSSASYNAFFFVALDPWSERDETTTLQAILGSVGGRLAHMPEARAFAFAPPAIPGLGTSSGFSFMLQDRSGGSPEALADEVRRMVAAAAERPEIGTVTSSYSASVPQVFVDVDRDKALAVDVELDALYGTLQAFMGSVYVNDFNRFGRQWRVYLGAEPHARSSVEDIGRFWVRNRKGEQVPLSTLVRTRSINGPEYTNRFNLYRAAEITGAAAPGYSSGEAMAAMEEVAAQTLSEGFGYDWSGLSYQERTAPSPLPTYALAVVLVFLILAAQYESWSLPWSVLLGTPVALAGALLGLAVGRMELNVYAQIGLLMLIGLAAKNAILIVEHAKSEVGRGTPVLDAALAAARVRLRPIVMTALAFVLGCLPLLFATGSGGAARQTLGTVVVAGMLAATVIGALLTPAAFVIVERLRERVSARRG